MRRLLETGRSGSRVQAWWWHRVESGRKRCSVRCLSGYFAAKRSISPLATADATTVVSYPTRRFHLARCSVRCLSACLPARRSISPLATADATTPTSYPTRLFHGARCTDREPFDLGIWSFRAQRGHTLRSATHWTAKRATCRAFSRFSFSLI